MKVIVEADGERVFVWNRPDELDILNALQDAALARVKYMHGEVVDELISEVRLPDGPGEEGS